MNRILPQFAHFVTWLGPDGKERKGLVPHNKQIKAFTDYKKVFIYELDHNWKRLHDEKGKRIVTLKHESELKVVRHKYFIMHKKDQTKTHFFHAPYDGAVIEHIMSLPDDSDLGNYDVYIQLY